MTNKTSKYHRHYQDFEVTTPTGRRYSMGLLEMGKQDTEVIVDAFKFRIQEIASAIRQPARSGSCNESG